MLRAQALRALLCAGLFLASGCTLHPERGPLADFFLKDYDLSAYDPEEANFQRERRALQPDESSGVLGGLYGVSRGGRVRAWQAEGAAGVGGLAGVAAAHAFAEAEHAEPLPETYEGFALALPIIATDPNKGPTLGILPVGVFKEGERITLILAPDVTYNEIDGTGGIFRLRRSFSRDANLLVDAGTSTEGNDDYEVRYGQRRVGPNGVLFFRGRFAYRTLLSERFFGIGNGTREEAESTYVLRRTVSEASLGVQLPLNFAVEFQERVASYKVGPGRLEKIQSTRQAFPNTTGVSEGRLTLLSHQIRLTYDSRDSRGAPTKGLKGEFSYQIADEALGSEVGFQRFGLSLTALIPTFHRRFVTALRFAGWIMTGDQIPFFERTLLGGKNTLRGYGRGRFADQNGYVFNVEERVNVLEYRLAGVRQILQVAGFFDLGRVFAEGRGFTLKDSKYAVGGAVRLVVPDSELVTSIDVGVSDEGPAVFVGLDYPY